MDNKLERGMTERGRVKTGRLARQMTMVALVSMSLSINACVTHKAMNTWLADLHSLKKRVLELERGLLEATEDSANKGNISTKQYTSNRQRLDDMAAKLQTVMGLLDALKVGVITGKYPGLDSSGESIAESISDLQIRATEIEKSHTVLMQEFKRLVALYDKKRAVKQNKKRRTITNLKGLRSAFAKQRYLHVFEDARAIIKRLQAGDNKHEAMYLHAESAFKLGRIRDAALYYNELVERAGDGEYTKTAKVRLGDCFRYLGDVATAKIFYEDIVRSYPQSQEAIRAEEKLQAMSKK